MIGNLNNSSNNSYNSLNAHSPLAFKFAPTDAVKKLIGNNGVTKTFRVLEEKPIVEIAGLDALTMILPRTAIDLGQNPVYGIETFFRETIPMLPNPFMPGIVGNVMNRMKGYPGLYVNSNTLRTMHAAWKKAGGQTFNPANPERAIVEKFVREIFSNSTGLAGHKNQREMLYGKLEGEDLEGIVKDITDIALSGRNLTDKQFRNEIDKVAEKYTGLTKAGGSVEVKIGDRKIDTNIKDLVRDTVTTADQIFMKQKPDDLPGVIDNLTNFFQAKAAVATGSSIALGASIQPAITYASRKITGKDGFTGYKDFCGTESCFKKTDSEEAPKRARPGGMILEKAAATAGLGLIMLTSMGAFKKGGLLRGGSLKKFRESLELKGPFAHMDIMRFVYGGILTGRFWAARDPQELKVSVARDYTGFLNWLVLGPIVAKGMAQVIDPSLLNRSKEAIIKSANPIKKVMNWLSSTSMMTIAERKARDVALSEGEKLARAAKHNGAMIGGLGYAMFALGIGVPMLINKYIIDKSREKQYKTGNIYSTKLLDTSQPLAFTRLAKKDDVFSRFTRKMS